VRWYLRYGLSYRDLEELLAEHGITVDQVTIGAVALSAGRRGRSGKRPRGGASQAAREFGKGEWNAIVRRSGGRELIVPASQVLHKRVTGRDRAR